MSHFQVTATLGSGATVLFGMESGGGALREACERLSWFPREAVHLTVTPVCGDPLIRLAAARVTARPASAEAGQ